MTRVYLAHPYGGKEENKKEIERYIDILKNEVKHTDQFFKHDYTIVSPVHTFEKEYKEMPYLNGIELCFMLLDTCDLILLPEDIFTKSKGCCMEYGYARAKNISIRFYNKEGRLL